MTGSNDKDTLDSFFREAFEQLPETPSPTGWDAPPSNMWSKIQTDLNTTPTPPSARFGRLWYVGAAGIVAMLALFLYFSQNHGTSASVADKTEVAATPTVSEPAAAIESATVEAEIPSESLAVPKKKTDIQPVKNTLEKAVQNQETTVQAAPVVIETSVATPIENTISIADEAATIEAVQISNTPTKVDEIVETKVEKMEKKKAFPNTLERLKAEAAAKEKAKQNPLWLDMLPKRSIPPVKL